MNVADAVGHFGNVKVDRKTIPFFCADISRYDVLKRHGLEAKRYITVHDGFDTNYVPLGDNVTKCWPLNHWSRLVALLKERLPYVTIVQLGSVNSREIAGVDLDLRKKTTLDEAAWILKHSSLHIDGESGLVRLANALHTRSVVLFGPTSLSFFGFDKNTNIVSTECNDCWLSTQGWLSSCPRGLATAICMTTITPETVASAVEQRVKSLRPAHHELCELSLCGDDDTRQRLATVMVDMFRTLMRPLKKIRARPDSNGTGTCSNLLPAGRRSPRRTGARRAAASRTR
jgi:ADP-heptose:LPS heptosyltransferase